MNSEGIDVRVTGGPVEEQMCQRSWIYCQQAAEAMPGLDQYRVCMTSSEAEAMKSEQLSVQVVLKQSELELVQRNLKDLQAEYRKRILERNQLRAPIEAMQEERRLAAAENLIISSLFMDDEFSALLTSCFLSSTFPV